MSILRPSQQFIGSDAFTVWRRGRNRSVSRAQCDILLFVNKRLARVGRARIPAPAEGVSVPQVMRGYAIAARLPMCAHPFVHSHLPFERYLANNVRRSIWVLNLPLEGITAFQKEILYPLTAFISGCFSASRRPNQLLIVGDAHAPALCPPDAPRPMISSARYQDAERRQGASGSARVSSMSWHQTCAAPTTRRACRGRTYRGTSSAPWSMPTLFLSSVTLWVRVTRDCRAWRSALSSSLTDLAARPSDSCAALTRAGTFAARV
ncbi:hypothetical protein QF038_001980 [Pseudarthrobacter sp. W1I19]|nr:hypothetical protein [Pseudarthrobacter sp. W1I19]